jgi:ABC-type Fe3+-hydroxamate transport system substrate-binding protein
VLELRTDRIADLERVIGVLGRVLGLEPAADSLVAAIRADIARATRVAGPVRPSVFILAWDRPPMTLGRGSFLSELLDLAGARNAFNDLPAPSAPISIEAVAERDPDFVLSHDVDLPAVALRPEWQAVRAVRERRFVRVHGSEFNRPSPRLGIAVRELAAALDTARR